MVLFYLLCTFDVIECRMRCFQHLVLVFFSLSGSGEAFALVGEVINYLSQYQIGVDYLNSLDHVTLSYTTAADGGVPPSCELLEDDSANKRCSVGMVGGGGSGFGLFLQRAFKKQGFWYFDYDIGFGGRYLSGGMEAKDSNLNGLPLSKAKFSLGAFVAKPYIEFGITPNSWPDLLISLGPAFQVACGSVTINDTSKTVVMGTSSYNGPMNLWHGFVQLEIVLKRFGDGAFSLIAEHDTTGSGKGTKIFPGSVDGMSDFRGVFSHSVSGMIYGFGLKLVSPWP